MKTFSSKRRTTKPYLHTILVKLIDVIIKTMNFYTVLINISTKQVDIISI